MILTIADSEANRGRLTEEYLACRRPMEAKAWHHLVWALRVTAHSYTRGIVVHRLATGPLEDFFAYQRVQLQVSPDSALARLPAELLAHIATLLHAMAKEAAEAAVLDYTWDRRRHSARQAREIRHLARQARERRTYHGRNGEEKVSTSDESPGMRADSDGGTGSESEEHRDKMDDRARFFVKAERRLNWKERNAHYEDVGPRVLHLW